MKTALQIGGKLPIYKAVYASEVSFLDRFQDTEYKQMNGRIFGECTTPQNLEAVKNLVSLESESF